MPHHRPIGAEMYVAKAPAASRSCALHEGSIPIAHASAPGLPMAPCKARRRKGSGRSPGGTAVVLDWLHSADQQQRRKTFEMVASTFNRVASILASHEESILKDWLGRLKAEGMLESGRIRDAELHTQCAGLLSALRTATASSDGLDGPGFTPVRELLSEIARARAVQGFSPSETATFVFSLKRSLFDALALDATAGDEDLEQSWSITQLVDNLGLFTIDAYQRSREEVIVRQQQEISELSTPVVKLWQGVLALPLIGTLDSQRTQVVMENLLESIVREGAEMAIIDITGVPTVDTLTAQHLLKTIAAARLMGADCIISGIRPQIAQTMVHLGVELSVVSKATLADAFALALSRLGRAVTKVKTPVAPRAF
jgi:rsbT co-antagonist protein RsbR